MEIYEKGKKIFEDKIKPILSYIGTIGAVLMSIAYIIIVIVMIFGFQATLKLETMIIFALINAIWGFGILTFLKFQGERFAKNENQKLIEQYYGKKTKDKKIHSMKYYWIKSSIVDAIVKGGVFFITVFGFIYIVIKGNGDKMLLLLGVVNLIMFICVGLISLAKAYEFYNNYHVAYMKAKLEEAGTAFNENAEKEENCNA